MKLVLAEPRYLKDSISIISELVHETRIKIDNDGMELIAMDPANVAMVIFKLLSSCFTQYTIERPEEICINLNQLKQILRRVKADDILTLEKDENKLNVHLKGTTSRSFSLPLIEYDEKEQKVPELDFPIVIHTKSDFFADSIEDVSIVAESVTLLAEKGKFSVKAEGDLSRAVVEISPDEQTSIQTDSVDIFKAKYSIEYLKKMMGGSKLAENVSIYFNTDYPLKLQYTEVDKLQLSFILAPRVDND
jgi:proliferating cell nuclear antigen